MHTTFSKLTLALALSSGAALASEKDHHDTHDHEDEKIETVQVTASRLGRIVNESATRIEVINDEEVQEKALMRPGNISMLVAETGGVRVQNTSPALGSSNIRLQGLNGSYTQLLSDGLPLYGSQTASIGLLQIPPTDLASVEIIKGTASSLYGGSALGGVINLISRMPRNEFEGEVLLNTTSQNGQDITSYFGTGINESFRGSVTAGLHQQQEQDLDNDGWLDIAGYERATLRPRVYWSGENGENLYLTLGGMTESRNGGTKGNSILPDGNPYIQAQDTQRLDGGFIYDQPVLNGQNLNIRGATTHQDNEHQFGVIEEVHRHEGHLLESNISGQHNDIAWLVGAAYQDDKFYSDDISGFNYHFQVPGIFTQVDYSTLNDVSISLSARADWHSEYGQQFSPRISLLYQPENWTIRGAFGQGYFAPTPIVGEVEDVGLSRLAAFEDVKEERATTASLDFSYAVNNIETSVTLFASDVENVTELEAINTTNNLDDTFRIVNTPGTSEIRGTEWLLRYRWNDIKFTGSYLYTDATKESATGGREPLTLTPKHSAGAVIMWEEHGSHLVGFEAYYTGKQDLENNPYRETSDPYWHLGLLAQITVGKISYFVNAENLLDVRQTKVDPLILPQQARSGRWTTDIWSRNDGLIFNAGIRVKFDH